METVEIQDSDTLESKNDTLDAMAPLMRDDWNEIKYLGSDVSPRIIGTNLDNHNDIDTLNISDNEGVERELQDMDHLSGYFCNYCCYSRI